MKRIESLDYNTKWDKIEKAFNSKRKRERIFSYAIQFLQESKFCCLSSRIIVFYDTLSFPSVAL